MKWYKLIVPAAVGATVGAYVGKKIKEQWIVPEVALKHVKELFKQGGPISGSWILMEKELYRKDGQQYIAYQGGISRTVDGQTQHYKFYVDASTGQILASYTI
ncbi:putative small secreted protein [Alkalibacillus filiformis]|uniref:Small secreted protein n=1 Tax=Alkalibacillus filiformis TaxID=200990 RepID=A0ABU0DS97_9BACI|nr:PepSY domain-containing protein [Alkalibacillus filiformis]MDQ0351297.1 putative small secreted protein [Alkalibacillus filiformis]